MDANEPIGYLLILPLQIEFFDKILNLFTTSNSFKPPIGSTTTVPLSTWDMRLCLERFGSGTTVFLIQYLMEPCTVKGGMSWVIQRNSIPTTHSLPRVGFVVNNGIVDSVMTLVQNLTKWI